MYRATTPTHIFTLPETLDNYVKIQVAYQQCKKELVKLAVADGSIDEGMDFGEKEVIIHWTEEETLMFDTNKTLLAQVRVKDINGNVMASQKFRIDIKYTLNEDHLSGE